MQLFLDRLLPVLSEPAGPARSITTLTVLAPRLVWHTASALALGLAAASCVPAPRYEEARSAAEVEMEGRRRAEHRVLETEHERDRLRDELAARESALTLQGQAIDESKLEASVAFKQRDQASELVEQLRGELARVGDHMRVFSDQKRDLEQALSSVDQARKGELQKHSERAQLRARMMRDLALLLHEPIASGQYGLDVREGELALEVGAGNLASESTFTADAAPLVKAARRTLELYPTAKIELTERDVEGRPMPSNARVEAMKKSLIEAGVPSEKLALVASSPALPPPGAAVAPTAPPDGQAAAPASPPAWPAADAQGEIEIRFVLG